MIKIKYVLFLILSFFVFNFNVYAEDNNSTGYVSDKSGVNMRESANTSSNILISIPYHAEFFIMDNSVEKGNGCSNNWFYVYYNNQYGYVCSNLVKVLGIGDTSYDRPWNSPKKAIIGGAKYISNGYISKGQYTSYLKKFNVNPNGYYPVYNHQYMANLRAPSSEAYTSYKSLKENGLLDNNFNFVIPEFLNMPDTTYDVNIKNTEILTADIQDDVFEESIKDFDESYKPYLRYLHTLHPNWTFTVMKTNLDFEASYLSEKAVSSIEISANLCEQEPYYETEKGWCIGNEKSTKFFLDPRNFLSEKYIFMFENLGYSELYTSEIIQTVLNGTFMNDLSILDNQKYSDIFVEAGKEANISSLYLASLARQESGVKESNTTNGKEFTYEGYIYSGIYNFYNIGAFSSASNPALAGLVWANGGRGANGAVLNDEVLKPVEKPNDENSNITDSKDEVINDEVPKVEEKPQVDINKEFLSYLGVAKVKDYINGYSLSTSVLNVKEKVGSNADISVKDAFGTLKNDNDLLGTGYQIVVSNSLGELTYTYVMYGDLTGDGEINSADLLKLRQHLLGTATLSGANLVSAYLNEDDEINSADLLKLRQHLLGTITIVQ